MTDLDGLRRLVRSWRNSIATWREAIDRGHGGFIEPGANRWCADVVQATADELESEIRRLEIVQLPPVKASDDPLEAAAERKLQIVRSLMLNPELTSTEILSLVRGAVS